MNSESETTPGEAAGSRPSAPWALPAGFDPAVNMVGRQEDNGVFHASRLSAELARQLVERGGADDLALAERVLEAVLACQETRKGDPHRGNFRWEREEPGVEDLNAAHFVLIQMLPMMIRHGDRLTRSLAERLRQAVRLALEEIARIDVGLEYTNIVLKDITHTLLGGELLEEPAFLARGREKFAAWSEFTQNAGGVYELNSPAYTPIALRVLDTLARHTRDPGTAVAARTWAARLGLTYTLRVLPETGRLTGPFCRAYWYQVTGHRQTEAETVKEAVRAGVLPRWLEAALGAMPAGGELQERHDRARELVYTTWMMPGVAMGTATKELDSQANRYIAGQSSVFTVHFAAPGRGEDGVLCTRYILDEKWLGSFRTTPGRTNRELLLDEGQFFGMQSGPRALGVYSPPQLGGLEVCSSAKLCLIVSRRETVGEIRVGNRLVEALPTEVEPGKMLGLACGSALVALRFFSRTELGGSAPIRLVEREGDLVVEVYNYLGPAKTFWELATPGSFFQGRARCGFFAEVGVAGEGRTLAGFLAEVEGGAWREVLAPAPNWKMRGEARLWSLQYERAGRKLGLEVDLLKWRLQRRWTEAGDFRAEPLQSPVAVQSGRGEVSCAGAKFRAREGNLWLFGNAEQRIWAGGGFAPGETEAVLTTPEGEIRVPRFRGGTVVMDRGQGRVDVTPG